MKNSVGLSRLLSTSLAALALSSAWFAPLAFGAAKPNAQMKAVLDQLTGLGGKPIETLTPAEARVQPTPADAVKKVLEAAGKPTAPEPVAKVEDKKTDTASGALPIRVYTPTGKGPRPIILYFHGGGWVIATNDVYDATPRGLANKTGAIVVAVEYRKAPEHKFPAAHDDAIAAYRWLLSHAVELDGDPTRIAVAGESAGGNLAAHVAIAAKSLGLPAPVHQLLVYPIAGSDLTTPSYRENADAKPLSLPLMKWFISHVFKDESQTKDPRISLVDVKDLAGLPSATIVTAQIDPLRSEGKAYAGALKKAGVKVDYKNYEGVAHEFFGMAAVLDAAKDAQARAAKNLKTAFSTKKGATQKGAPQPSQQP